MRAHTCTHARTPLVCRQVPEIGAKVAELRQRLPGVDVDGLVGQEPMLLRADLPRLMSELARLMPGADHVRLIAADPQVRGAGTGQGVPGLGACVP